MKQIIVLLHRVIVRSIYRGAWHSAWYIVSTEESLRVITVRVTVVMMVICGGAERMGKRSMELIFPEHIPGSGPGACDASSSLFMIAFAGTINQF